MAVDLCDLTVGWPSALDVAVEGRLELDGCDLAEVACEHGTPLWAISRATVEDNFDRLVGTFRGRYPRCEVAYSVKANNTMALLCLLNRRGALLDTSAEYELPLVLGAGIPPGDVIVNGNGKSDGALRTAARTGVRQVHVDSVDEVRRLNEAAEEAGTRLACLVRLRLKYDALRSDEGSRPLRIPGSEGKFGSSVRSRDALDTVAAVLEASALDFAGLHHHVGFGGYLEGYTPEHEVRRHGECAREVCRFANLVRDRLGAPVERLNLGGGFRPGRAMLLPAAIVGGRPAYRDLPALEDYADAISRAIEETLGADEPPLLQLEAGGHQVGNAVVLLTKVVEVKDVSDDRPRRYVVVDATTTMFASRGSASAGSEIVAVDRPFAEPAGGRMVEVVGQTCVHDSLAEEVPLPEVEPGDVLAVLQQGAYCETLSTQFNGFPRPGVALLDRGRATIVRRHETLADVHARDVVPPELRPPLPG